MKPDAPFAYRPDIDGLRAVAVLSVLAYHAFPTALPGGFAGVDVFFVISGYLISGIILREIEAGRFSLRQFYARRIRRIFPALILVLAASLAVGWAVLLADELRQLGKHVVASVGFGLNIVLRAEAGYFDTQSELKVLLHLWSLGVEEQYYIVWPLVALALARSRRNLLAIVLAAIVASFAYNVLRVTNHQAATFFLPFSRAWELLLGSLLAFRQASRDKAGARGEGIAAGGAREAAGWAGLALIGLSMGLLHAGLPFPGWYAALPTLGAALLILAGPGSVVSRTVLASPPAVAVGLISYPLYLWHWPLLTYARILSSGQPSPPVVAAALGASALLAWCTYAFVEKPIRAGRIKAVPGLVAGAGVLAACGLAIYLGQGFAWRKPALAAFQGLEARFEANRAGTTPCGGMLAPSTPLTWCATAGPLPPTLALIGDSHADHLFPGLMAAEPGRGLLLAGQSSCPPALGIRAGLRGTPEICSRTVPALLDIVLRTPSIGTVVIAALGPYYISETAVAANHVGIWSPANYALASADGAAGDKRMALQAGLQRTVQALAAAGKRVVLVADVPEMPFYPAQCVQRFDALPAPRDCSLPLVDVEARQRDYRAMLEAVAAAVPGTRIFDPLPLLCREGSCAMIRDGVPLYRDPHHLSLEGSIAVAGPLMRMVEGR